MRSYERGRLPDDETGHRTGHATSGRRPEPAGNLRRDACPGPRCAGGRCRGCRPDGLRDEPARQRRAEHRHPDQHVVECRWCTHLRGRRTGRDRDRTRQPHRLCLQLDVRNGDAHHPRHQYARHTHQRRPGDLHLRGPDLVPGHRHHPRRQDGLRGQPRVEHRRSDLAGHQRARHSDSRRHVTPRHRHHARRQDRLRDQPLGQHRHPDRHGDERCRSPVRCRLLTQRHRHHARRHDRLRDQRWRRLRDPDHPGDKGSRSIDPGRQVPPGHRHHARRQDRLRGQRGFVDRDADRPGDEHPGARHLRGQRPDWHRRHPRLQDGLRGQLRFELPHADRGRHQYARHPDRCREQPGCRRYQCRSRRPPAGRPRECLHPGGGQRRLPFGQRLDDRHRAEFTQRVAGRSAGRPARGHHRHHLCGECLGPGEPASRRPDLSGLLCRFLGRPRWERSQGLRSTLADGQRSAHRPPGPAVPDDGNRDPAHLRHPCGRQSDVQLHGRSRVRGGRARRKCRECGLLADGVGRRHLQLRFCGLLRLDRCHQAQQAHRGDGGHPQRPGLLPGGHRWGHLQLR